MKAENLYKAAQFLGIPFKEFLRDQSPKDSLYDFMGKNPSYIIDTNVISVVIVGFVPCGSPFPSDQERRGCLQLPAARIEGHHQDSLYAVQASGNSLIGDGIHDGDYLIVDRDALFVNGCIYIVLLGDEVVARHCYLEDNRVKLVASSGEYQDIEATQLVLLGRVILSGRWQEH